MLLTALFSYSSSSPAHGSIVIFTQFADTVRYPSGYRALSNQKTHKPTRKNLIRGLVSWLQLAPSWLFSVFLFVIAGYGYRLRYCLFWYLLTISGFALAYLLAEPHYFTWWMALGESVNVFHGRGASPIISQLERPARFTLLTVFEAWIGLMIEIVLVATAVQRFFGK